MWPRLVFGFSQGQVVKDLAGEGSLAGEGGGGGGPRPQPGSPFLCIPDPSARSSIHQEHPHSLSPGSRVGGEEFHGGVISDLAVPISLQYPGFGCHADTCLEFSERMDASRACLLPVAQRMAREGQALLNQHSGPCNSIPSDNSQDTGRVVAPGLAWAPGGKRSLRPACEAVFQTDVLG